MNLTSINASIPSIQDGKVQEEGPKNRISVSLRSVSTVKKSVWLKKLSQKKPFPAWPKRATSKTKSCKTTTKESTYFICSIRNRVRWSFIIIAVIIRKRTIWVLYRRSVWNWKIDRGNQRTTNKKSISPEKEQYVAWRK